MRDTDFKTDDVSFNNSQFSIITIPLALTLSLSSFLNGVWSSLKGEYINPSSNSLAIMARLSPTFATSKVSPRNRKEVVFIGIDKKA